jgi:DNA (cytosine-5)-methyltransferase 1
VVGVDINPQRHYPYTFIQGDALAVLAEIGHEFDAVHASPPCQGYSWTQRIQDNEHPKDVDDVRAELIRLGKPYIIENVPGAPLKDPVTLCGAMFGLRTYRHREFESSIKLEVPKHPEHVARQNKMGRVCQPDEFMHIVGNFIGAELAREIMECPWMSRRELREAIPPAYTRYLGRQLIGHV